MTRREYELLAAALRDARPRSALGTHSDECGWELAARAIADALARGTAPGGNRAFDRERFLRDAGVQS